jgi:sugar lactone lactonase YvrE
VGSSVELKQKKLLERLKELGLPSAAAIGAFSSLAKPESRKTAQPAPPLVQVDLSKPFAPSHKYALSLTLGRAGSMRLFNNSLTEVAIGAADRIYALGDGQVFILEANGDLVRKWKAPESASCLAVSPDKKVLIGASERVGIYSDEGNHLGGFAAGEAKRPARITSIKIFRNEILIADAGARHILRYDFNGKQLGEIGTKGSTGFMLPNRSLDIAVDSQNVIWATDPGRHRVSSWKADGSPIGRFGKFGTRNLEDFVGCCNPVNIAVAPDGKIVTGEKVAARVKVYSPDGKLLAVIGPEHFDPGCLHLHLAVDSKGRVIVADPVRLQLKIFSPDINSGVRESL